MSAEQGYSQHPQLAARDGALSHRVELILSNASRINGEPNYSLEKLWNVWALATLALVDELDADPQELADFVRAQGRRLESRS